jgi:hypothetical protein
VSLQQIHVWLGKPILGVIALMGFHAHCLYWLWTNLTPFDLLKKK